MDVLPAHLNRDSFRDSFKGLVALEIILDLPFGFPINNIISLGHKRVDSRFLVLAVSESMFPEITEYKYFSLIWTQFKFKYNSDQTIVPSVLLLN